LKILFLPLHSTEGASSRLRVYQYFEYLRKSGHTVRVISSPGKSRLFKLFYLIKVLAGAGANDIVFIQKIIFPRAFFNLIHAVNKRIIFDFDDAIYLTPPMMEENTRQAAERADNLNAILAKAACVIAGNPYLAEYAGRFNNNTVMIPTVIDTGARSGAPRKDAHAVVVGWIGYPENLVYLQGIAFVLKNISQRFGDKVVLKVVSSRDFLSDGINIINKRWRLNEELSDLQSFNIGISPLPDNEWTRAKCGFKILEYMAAGIPAVASPVGVNKEIVRDGVCGFSVSSADEWFEKLSLLIEDAQLRKKFGENGRRIVEERYSIKANAPKLLDALSKTAR